VLKKAGIIVATAAAGLLAVSSFAFADETVTKDNLSNACDFAATGPTVDSTNTANGFSLAAVANVITSAVAPITAQAQALNCNNVGVKDVLDFDSNNTDSTVTKTKVKDSFNTDSDD
jgi:hypothetical protein